MKNLIALFLAILLITGCFGSSNNIKEITCIKRYSGPSTEEWITHIKKHLDIDIPILENSKNNIDYKISLLLDTKDFNKPKPLAVVSMYRPLINGSPSQRRHRYLKEDGLIDYYKPWISKEIPYNVTFNKLTFHLGMGDILSINRQTLAVDTSTEYFSGSRKVGGFTVDCSIEDVHVQNQT